MQEPGSALSSLERASIEDTITDLTGARALASLLVERLRQAVLGRDEVITRIVIALLADGHVLLEDYPGSGKTTLAKALGESIEGSEDEDTLPTFRRIQFTPDLLPSDLTGVMVFEPKQGTFRFRPGPLFAYVVLADEINRTSPKVQSAMLEAMAEKQVTVDNRSRGLDELFFVIATQNPLDLAGTYPLPSPQLDRFLFRIRMQHIERRAELEVVRTWRKRLAAPKSDLPRVSRRRLLEARRALRGAIEVAPALQECLVDVARAIRSSPRVLQGASTRSLVLAVPALQALAMMRGRSWVSSEDLRDLIPHLFAHRVMLAPGAGDPEQVVTEAALPALETLARRTGLG